MAQGVTSANTVGFTTNETVSGYNFVGIPFVSIGQNTASIQQLSVIGADGWGGEVFEIWDGDPAPTVGYTYLDPANDISGEAESFYWGDDNYAAASFAIQPGQAAVLSGFNGDLVIRSVGQVSDAAITFETVSGYNFIANSFAAPIDIQDIAISGADGWGGEVFEIWDGDPAPTVGYTYLDPANDISGEAQGFYWGDDSYGAATFAIQPGQAAVLSGFNGNLTGTISSPYSL